MVFLNFKGDIEMGYDYMDYWRSNHKKKNTYIHDDYADSIYDYDYDSVNKVTTSYKDYSSKYKDGYSASSYWLNFSNYKVADDVSKLKDGLAFVCRSVNIIRHRYGKGDDKSLFVQWANEITQINTHDNNIVYLNPSPLIDSNKGFTENQKYDVIIGQALLASVQKHLVSLDCSFFSNNLLSVENNVSIICEGEELRVVSLDNKGNKVGVVNYIDGRFDDNGNQLYQEHIVYSGNKESFSSINTSALFVNGAIQVWRAIEQVIAETAISNEYRGSIAYLYSHRNFYNDSKYAATLRNALKVYDDNNCELLAIALAVHNVLNDNEKIQKDEVNEFYHPVIDMASTILRSKPDCDSETRLCSALHFSAWLSEYIIKKREENNFEDKDKVSNSDMNRVIDLTKNGLCPSLVNTVCKKQEHCNQVSEIKGLEVGDEKGIRNMELESILEGFQDVDITEENFYKGKESSYSEYSKFRSIYQRYIDMLRERLFVRTTDLTAPEFNLKSGNLDENGLWKLCDKSDDGNSIFYQENTPQKIEKCNINILFDNSGSMASNKRIDICRQVAVIMNEAVKGISNISLNFYSFTDSKFYKFENHEDLVAMREQGGTDEGGAMGCVLREINNKKLERYTNGDEEHEKTYFLALGDGQTEQDKVKKSLELIRRDGIKFFHIGIDDAYDKEYGDKLYGKDSYAIIPSKNLLYVLCNFLVKALT